MNDTTEATSDVGRLAILVSELQRDVMEMGKHLGLVMQRLQTIDMAAGQRLGRLEAITGVAQQQPAKENPKVVDLRTKVEVKEVDKPAEKEPA